MNNLPISVWLTEDNPRFLHCVICGFRLPVQIEGFPQTILYGLDANKISNTMKPLQFPIRINCKTKSNKYGDCPARYVIQGYIYPKAEEDEAFATSDDSATI
ncbi:MAG TPA: hypothetical protein VF941_12010 [Clostridia bacterium]